MKTIGFSILVLLSAFTVGCRVVRPLDEPTIIKNETLKSYKYIYISQTGDLVSGTGAGYVGTYGGYGSSTSKSVNPTDVVTGILIKDGFIRLPELKTELVDETLIVNYGESDKRNRGTGYTIEVTIQFVSAKSHTLICSCTAEGQGQTEADDIRQAISRCLEGLLKK